MRHFICIIIVLIPSYIFGQIGGTQIFQFLDFSNAARITALGENTYALSDDASTAYLNPSVLSPEMDGALSFNHNFRFEGIGNGYFSYAKYLPKIGYTAHLGVQYIDYGNFDFTNEVGDNQGSFSARETAVVIGAGKQWNAHWGFGVNAKYVTSTFETYKSDGIFFDVSAIYRDSTRRLIATVLIGNAGTQLSTFTPDNREQTPFQVAFGISKRMKKIPLTWYLSMSNLQRWRLENDNPFDDPIVFLGQEPEQKSQLATGFDNLMRHVSLGGELDVVQKGTLKLRMGYNHLRRKDLTVQNLRSLAGFSFGFGIKVKKFQLDYGNMIYHLAGSVNHFSISTNLNRFRRVL